MCAYFIILQTIALQFKMYFDNFVMDRQQISRILFWGHFSLFALLLLIATVGKRFGLRKRYINLLDKMFSFTASQMNCLQDTEEQLQDTEEQLQEDTIVEEQEVVISPESPKVRIPTIAGQFSLEDAIPYLTAGMRAVVDDCVSNSFSPIKLGYWNMLSRTKCKYKMPRTKSVTTLWLVGFFIRYVILVPVRMVILVISMATLVICTFLVGKLPPGEFKRKMNAFAVCWSLDFVANTLSVVARFHNTHNRPSHGIAVANHTSPLDSMVLATDNCYDMVGQSTGGFLGIFMNALSKSSSHIWFERSDSEQRRKAFQKLNIHSKDKDLPPLLIFPEGICVNNTAVMMFRKGVFELDAVIYPIAIKFDARYGDVFWHKHGFFRYVASMMSSWAIVCDVWYLPPMYRRTTEYPMEFAQRVKSAIAEAGGFKEVAWDGVVKVIDGKAQGYEKKLFWLKKQQKEFAKNFSTTSL